jgi:multiple sugar transport system substrate-binding protein
VKDFWAVPEYAELLTQINNHTYPYVISGEGGSAQAVLDNVAKDWNETFKKYGRGG